MKSLAQRIAALSPEKRALLERKRRGLAAVPERPRIPRRQGLGPWPASTDQAALWFFQQWDPDSTAYNIGNGFRLTGPLDVDVLARAFNRVIERHEVLRTTFTAIDGVPHQVVAPELHGEIPFVDVRGEPDPERAGQREITRWIRKRFDLEKGPLIRLPVIRVSDDDYCLVGVLHHTVTDWWSYHTLFKELFVLYRAFSEGRRDPLPELPIQFADYAVWRDAWLRSPEHARQEAYWLRQLAGAPTVLELPADRPRPRFQSFRGSREFFHVPAATVRGLRALNQRFNASSFMTLLATTFAFLYRYTGKRDFVVGTPVSADREMEETQPLIGYLLNTLVLRADLSGDPSFEQLIARVRTTSLDAFANKELPFRQLVEKLKVERDASRMPLYQVEFLHIGTEKPIYQGSGPTDPGVDLPGFRVQTLELDRGICPVDLQISFTEVPQYLGFLIEYNTDIFEQPTVRRMGELVTRLLTGMVERPERPISEIPWLAPQDRSQLLFTWNADRYPPAPDGPLYRLFELQAARTPGAVALLSADGGERVTYARLAAEAERLAAVLRRHGAGPGERVALTCGRSWRMVAGILGILRAGAAYLPLDPEYPENRLRFMLEDGRVAALLTEAGLRRDLPETGAPVVLLDGPGAAPDAATAADPAPDDAAYVIYTSGSTGRPKGVEVTHRGAVNLCGWLEQEFSREEMARVLASTSISFDMSVVEIFGPLATGGTVVVAENLLQLPEIPGAVAPTLVNTVPSAMAALLEVAGLPRTVRTVVLGGEPVPRALVDRLYTHPHVERVVNGYGPTETTVYSLFSPVPRDGRGPVLAGHPPPRTRAHVLDRRLEPAPVGVPGEVYLGGRGVARGYLGRAALTAERFVPDPHLGGDARSSGDRLYRTGDLARRRDGGDIEFLGRLDHQVKLRGYRIELGEVETALAGHPAVGEAVAAVRQASGDLVVGFTAAGDPAAGVTAPDGASLKAFLAERLPRYMIPSAFFTVDELPRTPSGKVDRTAIASLAAGHAVPAATAHEPPRDDLERRIAGLWSDLLGRERIGRHDDFFELGGHSLKATQIVSRLHRDLAVEIRLRDFFTHPTVAECAVLAAAAEASRYASIEPVGTSETYALSHAQRRLWVLAQIEDVSVAYNMPAALELTGELDAGVLERALDALVERHESLRTTFEPPSEADGGEPRQRIRPHTGLGLGRHDLRGFEDREARAREIVRRDAATPFDFERGPLLRASLIQLGGGRWVLALNVHHIVCDGWSLGVMVREVRQLYDAFARGAEPELEPLRIQYKDFAAWQNAWLESAAVEEDRVYWHRQLAGELPRLELPADHPRPAVQHYAGRAEPLSLGARLTSALHRLAEDHGASLFMVLLAAIDVLLHRTSGQRDLIVGTPIACRHHVDLEDQIGCYLNTLALRAEIRPAEPFAAWLERLRETALEAFDHQRYPFDRLVDELGVERHTGRSPVFDVMVVLHNEEQTGFALEGVTAAPFPIGDPPSKLDLTFDATEGGGELFVALKYRTDLYSPERIRRMAAHLERLLEGIAADPRRPVRELEMLTDAERREVVSAWNRTDADVPRGTLHGLFSEQARRTPGRVALRAGAAEVTYRQLAGRAGRVARHLVGLGLESEASVGVMMRPSIDLVAALLGVLEAGGAFVYLDPSHPEARRRAIAADAGARHLLADRGLGLGGVEAVDVQALLETPAGDVGATVARAAPESLAYMLYTSGSTGRPKGVLGSHRAAINRLAWQWRRFPYREGEVACQHASPSYVDAVGEIFAPLLAGVSAVIADAEERRDPRRLIALAARHGVSRLTLVPSLANALLEAEGDLGRRLPELKLLTLTGEPLHRGLARDLRRALPGVRLLNVYGASEAPNATCCDAELESWDRQAAVPIGRPLDNVRVSVLDARGEPAAVGCPGELHAAGESLARGYHRRAALTAERFVPDPFGDGDRLYRTGDRLYRTGDIARWTPEGLLQHLRRADDQMKVRGHRVEPGEVEHALSEHPDVRRAVVRHQRLNGTDDGELVAYVGGGKIDEAALRRHLRLRLPEFMVPARFVTVADWPLTPSGKVDRRALERLGRDAPATPSFSEPAAPESGRQRALLEIFRQVLGREGFGVDDDFFDLGGHSLSATRVVALVHQRLEVETPLLAVFQAPTVRTLAAYLDQLETFQSAGAPSPLAPLGGGGDRAVFVLPPILGYGHAYRPLAERLTSAALFGADFLEADDRLERYLEAIAETADGPYVLAGYSAGGNLAFELARLFESRGLAVRALVMVDSARVESGPDGPEDVARELAPYVDALRGDPELSDVLRNPYVEDLLLRRLESYLRLHRTTPNAGRVAADLHFVEAEGDGDTPSRGRAWAGATTGRFRIYPGAGRHFEMLAGDALEANARLLDEIFARIAG